MNCTAQGFHFSASSISCSQDGGVNWTARDAIPGAGDFPRVAVAADGTVYTVTLDDRDVMLNRFSSCANGLLPAEAKEFPVKVANSLPGARA